MPHITGTELLPTLQKDYSHIPIIVLTASENLKDAINCVYLEVNDYLIKPVTLTRLLSSVDKALRIYLRQKELYSLKGSLSLDHYNNSHIFRKIVTCNRSMQNVFKKTEYVSKSIQPVLITGESGVGKELIANVIHELSAVKGEFVCVNVAGLDDHMFTDVLFGHIKGGFTGATKERKGLVRKADGGTLFMDEIGDLSQQSQIKLLRYLQERNYYPIGSDVLFDSNARIILSTNKDLLFMVETGNFRKDLYYRLCAHEIKIPPLRDRLEDIPLLLDHFIREAAESLGKECPAPSPELLTLLPLFPYPGNIREFKGMVNEAVARHESGVLSIQHFNTFRTPIGDNKLKSLTFRKFDRVATFLIDGFPTMKEIEEYMIGKAIETTRGNKTEAAKLLGVTRQTINTIIKRNDSKRS
jgi:DNA-binding NtrC family response regulator